MKKAFILLILLTVFLGGCVIISLPGVEPLTEKVVGGKGDDKVLLIDISGIITDADANGGIFKSKQSLTARIKEELDNASEDKAIKAIVLRIDTPGGSVTTCDIVTHEILRFKKKRNTPVIAQFMDVAASGGYYIASAAADRIIAHPTTVTGSIGVVAFSMNASGLLDKIGIANQTIKSGDKKDIGSPLRPMTEEERRILQGIIDDMYERFLDVIIEGRKAFFTKDELRKIADGRVFTAQQAVKLKLIDSIGYLDDAIDAAKEKAGIKEATIVTYSSPRSYKNNIYSSLEQLPSQVNLINIDAGAFSRKMGLSFMYLWMP
ncbi:MAG: signal peptide peptidase SppA [Deltaproteobacteria bacterium]|nr:signal peptide peptidase SppA [Deltaproteobacteria bacterium]